MVFPGGGSESTQRDRNLKFSKTKIHRDLYGRHFIYDNCNCIQCLFGNPGYENEGKC